ncbi:MAG: ABC transporter ATP-binding protein [Candidatus Margulisbacteria bacterium]|jgi:ABC-2 type transport system ATP-binding protein|nr:ABC transporter ATP-binding protein [Candidatus Margulisiibacteriota bacterium]
MDLAVEARGLVKKFDAVTAVAGVDLQINKGEIFGLVGPDGAGKTTTLRLLSTALEQTAGEAFVLGLNVRNQEEAIRDRIGYMPQRFSLYGDLTVAENIDFFADIYGVPKGAERQQQADRLLAFTGMLQFTQRRAAKLSGGMYKKLALACMLIHTPEVLFLDEPTLGVDPISRREFWRILYGLKDVTIIVSTPYMDEAERCNRIGLIREGKMLAVDTPDAVKRSVRAKTLEEAFINIVETGRTPG